jgi:hypothetical protein
VRVVVVVVVVAVVAVEELRVVDAGLTGGKTGDTQSLSMMASRTAPP